MKRLRPLLAALFLAGVLSPARAAAPARPPNVVVLLADDQGWGDLSANGNTNLRTPAIDSLARAGTTLDRFYVCPVCSPTRAEFLSGRYHPRGGVRGTDSGRERLDLDAKTVADAFKAAGYATGAFGKWHNGSQWPYHPNARGFDEFYGFSEGHWGTYFNPPLEHNGQPVRGRGYIVDDLTDHALAFIAAHRAQPFFCYVPFNTPHSPFSVPDAEWNRFKDSPVAQRGSDGDRENLAVTRAVLAMTDNLDANVGRILRRLDELALTDNTIVVYFSDNGPNSARWNGGMKGRKTSTDEGGVRSPFFIRWPGRIPPGTTVNEIAGAIDLLPTLTALAGVTRVGTQPLDGRDLSPLLRGTARDWPERVIFSTWAGRASARSQRFRLDDRGALFDFTTDPGQKTDVAAQHPETTAQLAAALAAWRREMFPAGAPAGTVGLPDGRPIPVGYSEFPRTVLTAGDGTATGGVRRSNRFPNSSYFTNWTDTADTMAWTIDVHNAGTYAVTLRYTCAPADVGSVVAVAFRQVRLSGVVTPAWDPPLLDGEDRVPRQESYVKDFHPLPLGTLRLEAGAGALTVSAEKIAGRAVMDLAGVELTLLPAASAAAPLIPGQTDLFRNPFNKFSAHHRPVGAGAEYGVPGTTGPATRGRIAIVTRIALSGAPATLKYLHRVQPTDPPRRITYNHDGGTVEDNGLPIEVRMPVGVPYPSKGEDRNVILWPRDGGRADLCTMFYGFNHETGTARYAKAWPFQGVDFSDGSDSFDHGSGASRMRWPSGVVRGFEVNPAAPAAIRHALQCTATRHSNPDNRNSPKAPPSRHVLGKTFVWPAYGTDGGASSPTANLGDIPYGTRLVVRREDFSRRDTLGLSPRGLVLFDTFCLYGMYVVDGQGQYDAKNDGAVIQLRCDQEVAKAAAEDVNAQLMKILPLLWPVRNPRPLDRETEIFPGDGLPYAGGGGPLDAARSLNTAWDAK